MAIEEAAIKIGQRGGHRRWQAFLTISAIVTLYHTVKQHDQSEEVVARKSCENISGAECR